MSVALLLIFLGLMALGVPIAISLGAASVIVLITMGNMPLTMVVQLMYTSMNSFVMVAVPLFILAGSLMDDRLYNDYGIRYESRRTHEGRVVKLTLENSGA